MSDYSDLSEAPAPAVKQDYSDLANPPENQVSEPTPETHTAYVPERDSTVEHSADMSHDQVNDAVQTGVLERPRNLFFNPTAPDIAKGAADILTGHIESLAEKAGEALTENEPKLPGEALKAGARMAESIPKGLGGLLDMMGQNLVDQAKLNDPKYQSNLATTIGQGMSEIGKNAFEFYKERGENGIEAPDPEVFRGAFMSNPSVTRLVAGIIENVPLVAATAALSAGTGGAAPLALFGSMAAGESFESAKEQGSDTQKASLVGVASGIGNMVLMSLPLEKYIAALGKGALPEAALKSASFAGLGALMTPFNNFTARLGGDKTRKLTEGLTESLITMALSGLILGGMSSGRGLEIDGMIQDAHKNGVSPHDIDAAREVIAKQIQENPEAISEALLEHSKSPRELGAGIKQNEDGSISFEGPKGQTLAPEEVEGVRSQIVKTIAESLKKGEGIPEQFADHADLIDQALAENKRTDKNTQRRETLTESMSEQFMNGPQPKTENVDMDIVNEAKQRAIDKINAIENENGKIRNRYQQVRYTLTKELSDYKNRVETSTEETNKSIQERAQKEKDLRDEYEQKERRYKALYGEPTADEIASVDKSAKSQAQTEFVRELQQGRKRKTPNGPSTVADLKGKGYSQEQAEFIHRQRTDMLDRKSPTAKEVRDNPEGYTPLEGKGSIKIYRVSEKGEDLRAGHYVFTSEEAAKAFREEYGFKRGQPEIIEKTVDKSELRNTPDNDPSELIYLPKEGPKVVKLKTGEPKSGVSPNPIEGTESEGQSKGFERFKSGLEKSVKERIEQHTELSGSFGRVNAADDAAKGIKFVEENPESARRVALGIEAPPAGVSDVAVSGAYAEKMKREGNSLEQARAELSLSLRGTRQAQELALRGYRLGDNSPEQFIQKVIQARKDMAGKRFFDKGDASKRSDIVTKKINEESRDIKTRLESKRLDLEAAAKLLDEIRC